MASGMEGAGTTLQMMVEEGHEDPSAKINTGGEAELLVPQLIPRRAEPGAVPPGGP